MSTLNAERMVIYINNTYDIYRITEWLVNCLVKKMKKGLAPDANHLAYCSTMKKIMGMAAKLVQTCDGAKVTAQERREVALAHAASIIESAEYLVNN